MCVCVYVCMYVCVYENIVSITAIVSAQARIADRFRPYSVSELLSPFKKGNILHNETRNVEKSSINRVSRYDKPLSTVLFYSRWVAIYPPEDRIWFCSFRCPRSPRGRPHNRRNRQGHCGPHCPSRWYFARGCCWAPSGWPVWRASDDYYWRGPTAAAASTDECPEDDAEGTGPRALVPRLSPPCLEDRKRESLLRLADTTSSRSYNIDGSVLIFVFLLLSLLSSRLAFFFLPSIIFSLSYCFCFLIVNSLSHFSATRRFLSRRRERIRESIEIVEGFSSSCTMRRVCILMRA